MSEIHIFLAYVDQVFAIRAVIEEVRKCGGDAECMRILTREAKFPKRVVVTMTRTNAVFDDKSSTRIRIPFPKKGHRFSHVVRFKAYYEKSKD